LLAAVLGMALGRAIFAFIHWQSVWLMFSYEQQSAKVDT